LGTICEELCQFSPKQLMTKFVDARKEFVDASRQPSFFSKRVSLTHLCFIFDCVKGKLKRFVSKKQSRVPFLLQNYI